MSGTKRATHGIPFGLHLPSGSMLTAQEVSNGLACECVCAACHARLLAKQGPERIWHFAHYRESSCQYALEAAIHWMAKQMVAERGGIFVPQREASRTIYGERRVWSDVLTVEVQAGGFCQITDCQVERNVGAPGSEFHDYRRPDLIAILDGHPLAVEIRNTHAVDLEKLRWFEQRGFSALELDVSDLADFSPDECKAALETRLFSTAIHSAWLTHAKDHEAQSVLDSLEQEARQRNLVEERDLLAQLEALEAAKQRNETRRRETRDIEDFKIGLGACTLRIGRNEQRVTLKIHGHAPDHFFQGMLAVARRHNGRFIRRGRCWEFCSQMGTKSLFDLICDEAYEQFVRGLQSEMGMVSSGKGASLPTDPWPECQAAVRFHDPGLQEAYDERAAIMEFDAALDRDSAERQAYEAIVATVGGRVKAE